MSLSIKRKVECVTCWGGLVGDMFFVSPSRTIGVGDHQASRPSRSSATSVEDVARNLCLPVFSRKRVPQASYIRDDAVVSRMLSQAIHWRFSISVTSFGSNRCRIWQAG
jgi:hypothetical protein